ncbi:unnamed protein product [Caenorhabditis angaria]|uniref:Tox-GHH domain-containing protein n=1 Tax=Caenorhabditis angaria TaxID=860376 RepID=A0A9P1IGN8_9PELO|nr:unnamed protein product [Caenorhabditis angaria]
MERAARAARAARSLERLSGLSGLVARAPKPLRRSSGSMLERLSERAAQMALAAQRLKPSKPLKEVVKKLTDDLRNREQISVWKAERKRVDTNSNSSDEPLWINWTDREKRELKSKGSVSGYSIDLKSHSPYFSTIHSRKFVILSN